jgi:hypothetical protein
VDRGVPQLYQLHDPYDNLPGVTAQPDVDSVAKVVSQDAGERGCNCGSMRELTTVFAFGLRVFVSGQSYEGVLRFVSECIKAG